MFKPARFFSLLVAALLATACGGGGGSASSGLSPADATVAIDTANAIALVRNVNDSSAFAENTILGTVVGTATASSAAATLAVAGSESGVAPAAQSAAFCSGGNPGTAEVIEDGRFVTFSFMNCQDFSYTSNNLGQLSIAGLVNGTLSIEVLLTSQGEMDFQAVVTLVDFSIDDGFTTTTGDGVLTLDYMETASATTVAITTQSFDIGQDAAARSLRAYRFSLVDNGAQRSESSFGGISSSDFDELAYFETPQAFVTTAGAIWPSAGSLIIYGANQARIQVTALNDGLTARVELDLDEVDDFELSCTYPWDVLLGGADIMACDAI